MVVDEVRQGTSGTERSWEVRVDLWETPNHKEREP